MIFFFFQRQWKINDGKCGLCGDPWDVKERPHEDRERFPEVFVIKPEEGQDIIKIFAELPYGSNGSVEVRLCDSQKLRPTKACFEKNKLFIVEASSVRYDVEGKDHVMLRLIIPPTVICETCVLQWKFVKGN